MTILIGQDLLAHNTSRVGYTGTLKSVFGGKAQVTEGTTTVAKAILILSLTIYFFLLNQSAKFFEAVMNLHSFYDNQLADKPPQKLG